MKKKKTLKAKEPAQAGYIDNAEDNRLEVS